MWPRRAVPSYVKSLQTRRGTDWQSAHKRQEQPQNSEHVTVYPSVVTPQLQWQRRVQSILALFVNTARSPADPLEFGTVASVDTPSLAAHGNHSPVHPTPTTVFYAVAQRVQPQQTWLSSHNKLHSITSAALLLVRSTKRSETRALGPGVVT